MVKNSYSPKTVNPWDTVFKQVGIVFSRPYKHFPDFVKLLKKKQKSKVRVLDLGFGTGRHTLALAKEDFDVYGADISEAALKITSGLLKKSGLKARLRECDIFREKLPYRSNFFDAVLAIATIYHSTLWNIYNLINEIARILKPRGLFFCTTSISVEYSKSINSGTNYIRIEASSYFPLDGREKWLPHHYFTKEELRILLSKKFKDIRISDDKENYYMTSCYKK